jgi:endonuclease YncB( thermonuclease family)
MRAKPILLLLGLTALIVAGERAAVAQQRLAGRAQVVDGDSLEIGDSRLRLFGIDAPEGRQSCTRQQRDWACGDEAARKLRSLVGERAITCTQRDTDEYGRIVAVCRSGNVDLAAEMARSGFALAYRRYSGDYVDEENEARAAVRGIWAGEFKAPEQYRRDDRQQERPARRPTTTGRGTTEERAAPTPSGAGRRGGCDIKGNINNDNERIYHVPGSSSYDDTAIDTSRGERWFCSDSEAVRAGWRAPRGR